MPFSIPGTHPIKIPGMTLLKQILNIIATNWKGKGVTKALLWEEYRQSNPDGYRYSQFCHHLAQQQSAKGKPSLVLDHRPAETQQMDFAATTVADIDRETGEVIECQFCVACLPYSDYACAMAVPSQSTGDFLFARGRCLEDLGGVPRLLVPDNLKAAVVKADRHEPVISRALEDFANHYGTA